MKKKSQNNIKPSRPGHSERVSTRLGSGSTAERAPPEKSGWAKIPGMAAECGCLQDQACDYHMDLVRKATEESEQKTRSILCPHCDEQIEITDDPQSNFMAVGCHMSVNHIDILIDALFGISHKPTRECTGMGQDVAREAKRRRPGECPGIVDLNAMATIETIHLEGRQVPKKVHYSGCVDPYCGGCYEEGNKTKHRSGCTNTYCVGCTDN